MAVSAMQWLGPLAGIASQTYNKHMDAQTERRRIDSQRDLGLAQAAASASQGESNRQLLNNVLLGVGALLGLMVIKKALA